MNFAELRFWGLLLLGIAVISGLRLVVARWAPAKLDHFDKIGLLALGWFLLFCVSWLTFLIFLLVAFSTYFGLASILRSGVKAPSLFLWILIPFQLLPLVYYKYSNFLGNQVLSLNMASLRNLAIPVGLSFYTFQKVAFVCDTLAFRQELPGLLDFLNFASFFPQIVAGPIERRRDLLPQMQAFSFRWDKDNFDEGLSWILVGMFFKLCLADNLAKWNAFFLDNDTNPFAIWLCNLLFGFRIYYDFAGYSLVAFGLARMLGVRLTLNFASPYCATSVQEFWRRWHVTLSNWFRDYLYVPLGGGKVRWWALNLAIVFVVSGLWHGAGWNFLMWGALHAAFLILFRLLPRDFKFPVVFGWAATVACAFFSWLCFYETRVGVLWIKLGKLITPAAYNYSSLRNVLAGVNAGDRIVLIGLLAVAASTLAAEWISLRKGGPYSIFRRPVALSFLVMLTILLAPGKNNAFIYFAF